MGMTEREKIALEKLKQKEKEMKKEERKKKREFQKQCMSEFGHTPEEIKGILMHGNGMGESQNNGMNNAENKDDDKAGLLMNFARKVADYYELESAQELAKWCEIMLNERSLGFWKNKRSS